ncbi:MAG: DUF4186 domain-containing protein [Bacilli bacterium]|nr:DUF4186 domain-containing protein [Bacilli bacterium]
MKKEEIINNKLAELSKSKFRSSFHLNNKMKEYTKNKGLNIIKNHTYELIKTRLGEAYPQNDGKQTPMKQVHPVFIAQHACACCCRNCLKKWHNIPKERALTNNEINYIVELLITWIKKEIK